ncbi:MAG TPA: cation:proton antiporter [Polyangia bacterium]|nr:cation:proton antiporter [Polyangia bacterium]
MPAAGRVDLVFDLAIILLVAGLATALFQRLRQPAVLGYLLAGLIVGPHLPIPLFADETVAHTLSELGVVLLMFSLGLEFNLRKLVQVAPTAGVIALIECSLALWAGYGVGRAFGWNGRESLFLGAMIAISSTTIIVKAYAEQGIGGRLAELVFGELIVEDLIAILLLAVLTAVGSGAGLSARALALTIGKLAAFLAGTLAFGMLIVPRFVRAVIRLQRPEITVVAASGICFGVALLARSFGYSVALGAFLGGALVGESGAESALGRLVEPVRDVFAAIFFVSVGMLIDPHVIVHHAGLVAVLALVITVVKIVGVSIGVFLTGNGIATAVRAGMSFAQIGEFSFIIATVGLSLHAIPPFLYPVAVAVSAVTTFTTPWLIRAAGPVAATLDQRLPHALQTYASLYGAWVDRLRNVRGTGTTWARVRRLALLLVVDTGVVAAVIVATSMNAPRLVRLAARFHWRAAPWLLRALLWAAALALAAPFARGAVRVARALGLRLAVEALPSTGAVDLSAAPRRALVVTIQIAILLAAGIPLMAVTQPFLPWLSAPVLLLVLLAALVVPLWRSAADLQGHVRAGAQIVLERLAAQGAEANAPPPPSAVAENALAGIGAAQPVRLAEASPAVGCTLKQLQLRGRTSATVVVIERRPGGLIYPTGDEPLQAGDVLVLTGSREAVAAAQDLLEGRVQFG